VSWDGQETDLPLSNARKAVSHQHSAVSLMLVIDVSTHPVDAIWLIADG
jgi:hypothetical protein